MSNDFKMKKKFGQNFIKDNNIIEKIVNLSLVDEDTLVVEVGPGAGVLTKELAKYAKNVVTFEIDKTLKPILDVEFKSYENIELIFEDFLDVNLAEYLEKYEYKKLYLIANLPYYITTPIITKVTESSYSFDKIVVMVQKEVAERFSSKPCSRDYNSLTVFLNYYYDINKLFDVSRKVFYPIPNVDSAVVAFYKKETRLELKNEDLFFKLVREAFVHKRKTIRNNLFNYDLSKIEEVLISEGLSLTTRAEAIPLEIFVKIANKLD